ncbi:MAG TPA: CAP domain-containing protein [Candidatus Acidoferrum sp.]|jgi:hypothetical protein|nr:CAP domain-containing protein [Candidatus Acidoferrum sp.]
MKQGSIWRFHRVFSRTGLPTLFVVFVSIAGRGQDNPLPTPGPTPKAPPPAPPIQSRPKTSGGPEPHPLGFTPYSIGQPTDEEELYLEYLNRMRANPTAEGQRLATTTDPNVLSAYSFFGVDLNLMQSEFSTNPPVPPLAMNAQLLAAARWHSGDMYTNQYQGHNQTNGSIIMDPGNRMSTNGYNWSSWGENVYSYADSVFHGHAGFAVDWGPGTGGMQTPPGHRNNMLTAGLREVGMGVVDGVNGSVGPQLITQDFGTRQGATPLITGVIYYDFKTNGFYDLGEGIGGVTVNTPGSVYYAVTANSGGFTIPVPGNGSYTLTFTAPGLSNQAVVTVSSLNNVKVDYTPLYSSPVISGPNPASVNLTNIYTFTPVGGATNYQWQQMQLSPYTYVEGAENGLTKVTVVSSAGYSVIATDLKNSGTASFHLAQPDAANQYLTLNPTLLVSASSQLSFAKYLGWASSSQVAKAQVSADGGASWQDVWSQAGTGGSGDSAFSTINVSLSGYAGQNVQVRFAYLFSTGSFFNQTSTGVGLYLDDIAVSNVSQLMNQLTNSVQSGASFAFYPTNTTTYLLQVRAQLPGRTLNWGPSTTIAVTTPPPVLQVAGVPTVAGSQVQLDFTVANYRSGMTLQLWKAADPTATWAQDTTASLQTLIANSKFRFTTTTGGAARMFYRIKGTY